MRIVAYSIKPDQVHCRLRSKFLVMQSTASLPELIARINCPTGDDDSFRGKVDDENFVASNGLRTGGWKWVKLDSFKLKPGKHTLTMTYREDGARIDKIGNTASPFWAHRFGC